MAQTGWSPEDDQRLRKFYAAFRDDVVPVDAIAEVLGRTVGAVRYRANKLGLTQPATPRKRAVPDDRQCAECGTTFTPRRASDPQKTCGRSCAAKQRARGGRGRATGRAKVGRRADLHNIFFRSAWEANYARVLVHWQTHGEIAGWEYEPQVFPFPVKRGIKHYLPDFKVYLDHEGTYEWHEVKGWMDNASRIKLKRFSIHHPAEAARLKLIDRPRYEQLRKEFAESLPGWES